MKEWTIFKEVLNKLELYQFWKKKSRSLRIMLEVVKRVNLLKAKKIKLDAYLTSGKIICIKG